MEQRRRGLRLPPVLLLLSLPGCFSIRGPRSVRGVEGDSLAVQCSYSLRWWLHGKLWCRGARWDTCRVLVQTSRGAEHQAEGERVAIRDNPWARTFTVTMRQLRPDDADTYWCGITEAGSDRSVRVTVAVDPAATYTPKHNRRLHFTATDAPRAATPRASTRLHSCEMGDTAFHHPHPRPALALMSQPGAWNSLHISGQSCLAGTGPGSRVCAASNSSEERGPFREQRSQRLSMEDAPTARAAPLQRTWARGWSHSTGGGVCLACSRPGFDPRHPIWSPEHCQE